VQASPGVVVEALVVRVAAVVEIAAVVVAASGVVVPSPELVVLSGPGPSPHWHKSLALQGHQDCPPIAHGMHCSSVAPCGLPGIDVQLLQALQLLAGKAVLVCTGVVDEMALVVAATFVVVTVVVVTGIGPSAH